MSEKTLIKSCADQNGNPSLYVRTDTTQLIFGSPKKDVCAVSVAGLGLSAIFTDPADATRTLVFTLEEARDFFNQGLLVVTDLIAKQKAGE